MTIHFQNILQESIDNCILNRPVPNSLFVLGPTVWQKITPNVMIVNFGAAGEQS